jgi:hypothetical protein
MREDEPDGVVETPYIYATRQEVTWSSRHAHEFAFRQMKETVQPRARYVSGIGAGQVVKAMKKEMEPRRPCVGAHYKAR